FKASDISSCLYKIRDDSVRLRQFLSTDNVDGIEAILSEREGHSLHKIIDGDEPL
ncbi:17941_t:CDS:1, partial [Funneliformis geosporum]